MTPAGVVIIVLLVVCLLSIVEWFVNQTWRILKAVASLAAIVLVVEFFFAPAAFQHHWDAIIAAVAHVFRSIRHLLNG